VPASGAGARERSAPPTSLRRPSAAQQPGQSAVAAGAKLYGDMCGRCHRPRSPLERTDRDWVTIVTHMRVRANLTGQQARAVLAFLQATNGSPSEAPAPAMAPAGPQPTTFSNTAATDAASIARGKALVASKACVGCHVIGARGGQVGPSLDGVVERRTAAFVRHKLTNPSFNNATSMMPNFGLAPEKIDAIVAYLNTLDGR
jgi:mono/diheme cytochrome c family protein